MLVAGCGRGTGATPHAPSARYVARDATGASIVNVYAATGVDGLDSIAARAKPMVYVPNSKSATVTEIDPTTLTVVRTFGVDRLPQHVVPAYDKTKLWWRNNEGNCPRRSIPRRAWLERTFTSTIRTTFTSRRTARSRS